MNFSLNEVQATAKKAARGAGYAWGVAEEAGAATRALCSQHLDGCHALAALLAQIDGQDPVNHAPRSVEDVWTARAEWLCPLMAGATLSDMASRLRDGPQTMAQVTRPLLLLPFAAAAAEQLGSSVVVTWPGQVVSTDGRILALDATVGLTLPRATQVTVRLGALAGTPSPRHSRATPQPDDWSALDALAARLLAPATEASRRLGAGSGDD